MKIIEVYSGYDQYDNLLEQVHTEKTFDNNELISNEVHLDSIGNKILEKIYEYENGLLVGIKKYSLGELISICAYSYDADKRKIGEVWQTSDSKKISDMVYNPANNEFVIREYDEEGNVVLEKRDILDDNGNIIKEIENEDYVTEHIYENGKKVSTRIYEAGEMTLQEEYFFDENGNEIGSKGIDYEADETITINRKFNESNKVTSEKEYLNGTLEYDKIYTYDEKNRIIRLEIISTNETGIREFQYIE